MVFDSGEDDVCDDITMAGFGSAVAAKVEHTILHQDVGQPVQFLEHLGVALVDLFHQPDTVGSDRFPTCTNLGRGSSALPVTEGIAQHAASADVFIRLVAHVVVIDDVDLHLIYLADR